MATEEGNIHQIHHTCDGHLFFVNFIAGIHYLPLYTHYMPTSYKWVESLGRHLFDLNLFSSLSETMSSEH
jgi:hypothetical protein